MVSKIFVMFPRLSRFFLLSTSCSPPLSIQAYLHIHYYSWYTHSSDLVRRAFNIHSPIDSLQSRQRYLSGDNFGLPLDQIVVNDGSDELEHIGIKSGQELGQLAFGEVIIQTLRNDKTDVLDDLWLGVSQYLNCCAIRIIGNMETCV